MGKAYAQQRIRKKLPEADDDDMQISRSPTPLFGECGGWSNSWCVLPDDQCSDGPTANNVYLLSSSVAQILCGKKLETFNCGLYHIPLNETRRKSVKSVQYL